MRITGAVNDAHWRRGGWRRVRGKWHGYHMELNLADWSERMTWFLGRYHELDGQLLMDACVREGERVVDVGANIGMLSLHAARRVGPGGAVDSFEPNPECGDRIHATLVRNRISHVRLHRLALSDSAGTLTLKILENHTGMGTLAPMDRDAGPRVTGSVNVAVRRGDLVLEADGRRITFIKVDVEGFEVNALRGLRAILLEHHPVVATEVIPEWLERAGSSARELGELMSGLGYEGYCLETRRKGLKHRLSLEPLGDPLAPPPGVFNVAWVPKGGGLRSRLGL
jgi:FkbM family methyltransferase